MICDRGHNDVRNYKRWMWRTDKGNEVKDVEENGLGEKEREWNEVNWTAKVYELNKDSIA